MNAKRPTVDDVAHILLPHIELPTDRRTWPKFIREKWEEDAEFGFSGANVTAKWLYARWVAVKVIVAFLDEEQTEETGEIE